MEILSYQKYCSISNDSAEQNCYLMISRRCILELSIKDLANMLSIQDIRSRLVWQMLSTLGYHSICSVMIHERIEFFGVHWMSFYTPCRHWARISSLLMRCFTTLLDIV